MAEQLRDCAPSSLGGQSSVNIVLTADGKPANTVNITIQ
jgi:hypothetical protein